MNILPKKKWHVRTKENIQRVRRDEAKAAEAEKRELERQIEVENERRMNTLRKQADARMQSMFGSRSFVSEGGVRDKDEEATDTQGHVNFFEDLEREERKNLGAGNQEYEKEKEKEKNEWEKKMGILVHLGDGSNELEKNKEWYEKIPKRGTELAKPERWTMPQVKPRETRSPKKENKKKRKHDKRDLPDSDVMRERERKRHRSRSLSSSDDDKRERKKKKKLKKEKKKKDRKKERDGASDEEQEKKARLAILREERIRREREEASRTFALLHPEIVKEREKEAAKKAPKYNSMFNPHLAR